MVMGPPMAGPVLKNCLHFDFSQVRTIALIYTCLISGIG
jgi:hypothetical protein